MRTPVTIRPGTLGMLLALAGAMVLAGLPILADAQERNAATNRQLAEVRQATNQYHDLATAEEAGYVLDEDHCIPGMGHHAHLVDDDGAIVTDPDDLDHTRPELLLYAPRPNGTFQLVAVEYAATGEAALFERGSDAPAEPPPFHALHAWVWQGNPEGVFNPTNPKVSCPPAP